MGRRSRLLRGLFHGKSLSKSNSGYFAKLAFLAVLAFVCILSGCGGGRSGTNAGNDLKFGVVFEFKDPVTGEPRQGVHTSYIDQEYTSDKDGNAAFSISSINASLLFNVSYLTSSESLNLETPAKYNLNINKGIYVIVDVATTASNSKAEIKVIEIIPIPKDSDDLKKNTISDDPLTETEPQTGSDNDKPDPESPFPSPSVSPSATPEPEPTTEGLTAGLQGTLQDEDGNPLGNIMVAAARTQSQYRVRTDADGHFSLEAPIYHNQNGTSASQFIYVRVGPIKIEIPLDINFDRVTNYYSVVLKIRGLQLLDFNYQVVSRPPKKKTPAYSTNSDQVDVPVADQVPNADIPASNTKVPSADELPSADSDLTI